MPPAAPRLQAASADGTVATDAAIGQSPAPAAAPASPVAEARAVAATATPVQAEVQAELGSREFAPALGSQLRVMVRDGIEHAQLKLNPAEMGPIEVRISVDGGQAQVDFSAAQAHTRQALQDAVPVLASALRESGLTLIGGGFRAAARITRRSPWRPARHGGARRGRRRRGGGYAPARRARWRCSTSTPEGAPWRGTAGLDAAVPLRPHGRQAAGLGRSERQARQRPFDQPPVG